MKETFFQICIMFTIGMFIFSLCVHYVSGLGLYGDTDLSQGLDIGDDANSTIRSATKSNDYLGGIGVDVVFGLVLTGAGIAGIVVAWLTHSTAIIGVFIFSAAFWAAYLNTLGILNIGFGASSFIDPGFVLIGTAGMGMIWIGAIAGMLSGSG